MLGPFNTTRSDGEEDFVKQIKDECIFYKKATDILKLSLRVRGINNHYEANNNQRLDNGVYNVSLEDPDEGDKKKNKSKKKDDKAFLETDMDSETKQKRDKELEHLFKDSLVRNQNIIQILIRFGYPEKYTWQSLLEHKNNHCTTTYYLLGKD